MKSHQNSSVMSEQAFTKWLLALAVFAAIILLFSPQANAQSGNVYGREQTQTWGSVIEGTVLQVSMRKAASSWESRAAGAAIGTAVGYHGGRNSSAPALLATLGGLIGERVGNAVGTDDAQEIIVQVNSFQNGGGNNLVTVVQPAPFESVSPGEAVMLINTAGKLRVVKRPQAMGAAPAAMSAPVPAAWSSVPAGFVPATPSASLAYFR